MSASHVLAVGRPERILILGDHFFESWGLATGGWTGGDCQPVAINHKTAKEELIASSPLTCGSAAHQPSQREKGKPIVTSGL